MITRRGPRPGREQTVSETILADWWRGCVIYQVYPRSYQDTSGDGIGDLQQFGSSTLPSGVLRYLGGAQGNTGLDRGHRIAGLP